LIQYTNSRGINLRTTEYQEGTSIVNAARINSIKSQVMDALTWRCSKCNSIITLDGADLLDLDGKRHFCNVADRISHEEECMIKIQKIIEYYNRRELSSFHIEVNIP
jgi:hypothetical protein